MSRFLQKIVICLTISFSFLSVKGQSQASKDSLYLFPEVQARFSYDVAALRNFMTDNLHYPQTAQDSNKAGRVWISFIVNKDGKLSDISLLKSVSTDLDSEALRVVKLMPGWVPAHQGGEAVRSKYNLPVDFRLKRAPGNPQFTKGFLRKLDRCVYSKELPRSAFNASVMTVKLKIDELGNCVDVEIVKSGGRRLDDEVIRCMESEMHWIPATDSFGDPVATQFSLNYFFSFERQQDWLDWEQFETEDTSVDWQPAFQTGAVGLPKYLKAELKPKNANGVVIVRFQVSETGVVSGITIKKSVSSYADNEAIRVVQKMPPWLPALKNGKPVASFVDLPVFFNYRP